MKLRSITHYFRPLGVAALAMAAFAIVNNSQAAPITKAATGTDLTAGASWGGTAPGSGDVATWASTSLGAGLTLATSRSWSGINVASALSAIDVTGAGTLTIGSDGINMASSTVNLTLGTPIALGSSQTWTVNSGRTLTASGIISGTAMVLTNAGSGTLTIKNAANNFSGGTIINAGQLTMDLQANAALGTGSITLNGGRLFLERVTAVNALTVNGGDLWPENGFGDNWNGPVTLNSNLIIQGPGYATMTFNGSIRGTGGLTLNGQGPVVLAVSNTDDLYNMKCYNPDASSILTFSDLPATSLGGFGKFGDTMYAYVSGSLHKMLPTDAQTHIPMVPVPTGVSSTDLQEFMGRLYVGSKYWYDGVSVVATGMTNEMVHQCVWRDTLLFGIGAGVYWYGTYDDTWASRALPGGASIPNYNKNASVEFRDYIYVATETDEIWKIAPGVSESGSHPADGRDRVDGGGAGDTLYYAWGIQDGGTWTTYLGLHEPISNLEWLDTFKLLDTDLDGEVGVLGTVPAMVAFRNRLYIVTSGGDLCTHVHPMDPSSTWYRVGNMGSTGVTGIGLRVG